MRAAQEPLISMHSPTQSELLSAGYTSVRKTESRGANRRPRTIEVFQRTSDSTYWWMMLSPDGTDPYIVQVEPVTVGDEITYHQIQSQT